MSDFTFPRTQRIRTSREYRAHRRRAKTFRTRHFLVSWANGRHALPRLGLTVSKKVGNSPQRSRVKRLLREWFRLHHHELKRPWDLVIIARAGATELGLSDVEDELDEFVRWINRARSGSRRNDRRRAPPKPPEDPQP